MGTIFEMLLQKAKFSHPKEHQGVELEKYNESFQTFLDEKVSEIGLDCKTSEEVCKYLFEKLKFTCSKINIREYNFRIFLEIVEFDVIPLLIKEFLIQVSKFGLNFQNQNILLKPEKEFEKFLNTKNSPTFYGAIENFEKKLKKEYQIAVKENYLGKLNAEIKQNKSVLKFYKKTIHKNYVELLKINKETKKMRVEYFNKSAKYTEIETEKQNHKFELDFQKNEVLKLKDIYGHSPTKNLKNQIEEVKTKITEQKNIIRTLENKLALLANNISDSKTMLDFSTGKSEEKFTHSKKLENEFDVFLEKQKTLLNTRKAEQAKLQNLRNQIKIASSVGKNKIISISLSQ